MKEYFSKDFKRLLYGLLDKNVSQRLTLSEAMNEPFFKKINWD